MVLQLVVFMKDHDLVMTYVVRHWAFPMSQIGFVCYICCVIDVAISYNKTSKEYGSKSTKLHNVLVVEFGAFVFGRLLLCLHYPTKETPLYREVHASQIFCLLWGISHIHFYYQSALLEENFLYLFKKKTFWSILTCDEIHVLYAFYISCMHLIPCFVSWGSISSGDYIYMWGCVVQYLFDSMKDITIMPCGHTMHLECIHEMDKHAK